MNIQYKIPEINLPDQIPDHLFLLVPSNPTHRKMFYQYERSFTETKMIGMISTKENFVFLISPRNEKVLKYYPEMEKGHLLGIYFIKTTHDMQQPQETHQEQRHQDSFSDDDNLVSNEMNLSAFD